MKTFLPIFSDLCLVGVRLRDFSIFIHVLDGRENILLRITNITNGLKKINLYKTKSSSMYFVTNLS
jgi:hypothetical protein